MSRPEHCTLAPNCWCKSCKPPVVITASQLTLGKRFMLLGQECRVVALRFGRAHESGGIYITLQPHNTPMLIEWTAGQYEPIELLP